MRLTVHLLVALSLHLDSLELFLVGRIFVSRIMAELTDETLSVRLSLAYGFISPRDGQQYE
jgi:hypothetical protein